MGDDPWGLRPYKAIYKAIQRPDVALCSLRKSFKGPKKPYNLRLLLKDLEGLIRPFRSL